MLLHRLGVAVDAEAAHAHCVHTMAAIRTLFFFGFKDRLNGYAAKTGLSLDPTR